jgi:L-cystine transport system permease protein
MEVDFFSFDRVVKYFPKILSKFPTTLSIVFVAISIALILGTTIALIRIKKIPVLNQLALLYISFIRGTPILVQLFLIYYGIPLLIVWICGTNVTANWNKMIFVYIAYGLNEAGFLAEQIRAAIQSVPAGQTEAGLTVGLTPTQTFFRIVFPQAFRVFLPGFSTALIGLLPATSLAYMLGVMDMMGQINSIANVTHHSLEGYFSAALIFVLTSILLERVFFAMIKKTDYEKRQSKEVKAL